MCPELLDLFLQAPLFTPPNISPLPAAAPPPAHLDLSLSELCQTDSETRTVINTPSAMAALFSVPYLGKLPMDPNMMYACENGFSFLEKFPNSPAAGPFTAIVDGLIRATEDSKSTATTI